MLSTKEQALRFHARAREIFANVPGWRLEALPEDLYRAECWLKAVGPLPEAEINLHAHWRDNRISVSGTFPKSNVDSQNGHTFGPPHGVDRPAATVAMDRPAHKLAAEICRRVINPYMVLLAEAIDRRNAYDACRLAERKTVAHLAKLCNAQLRSEGATEFYPRGKVDTVTVSHYDGTERVNMKLRDLSAAMAETVIRLIQETEEPAQEESNA